MKNVIVVCGNKDEWLEFINNLMYNYPCDGDSLYDEVIADIDNHTVKFVSCIGCKYRKIMGYSKYRTKVIYIGTWYKYATTECLKYLELFEVTDDGEKFDFANCW